MNQPEPRHDQGSSLAVVDGAELGPIGAEMQTWRLMRQQADVLVKSGFLGSVKTAEQALAIIVLGQELGFQRMQSFRLIDVINGKPTLNSHGMATLVQRYCRQYGGYLRVVESTTERAVIEFKRPEWPTPHQVAFTTEDAQRAGLPQKDGPWKLYPQNMLYARALANACRMGFPDVVGGIYDPDQLGGSPAAGFATDEAFGASVSIGAALDAGEHVDLATGEIIEADPGQPADPDEARDRHSRRAHAQLAHDALHALAVAVWGVPSLADLTETDMELLADAAEVMKRTGGPTTVLDIAVALSAAGTVDQLQEQANRIGQSEIGGAPLDLLRVAYRRAKEAIETASAMEQGSAGDDQPQQGELVTAARKRRDLDEFTR